MSYRLIILLIFTIMILGNTACVAESSNNSNFTANECEYPFNSKYKYLCFEAVKIDKKLKEYQQTEKDIFGYSTEGGELKSFSDGFKLKKLTVTNFGEMGQRSIEYYFDNSKLFFMREKTVNYDKPIYENGSKEIGVLSNYCFFPQGVFESCLEITKEKSIKLQKNVNIEELQKELVDYINEIKN